MNVCVLVDVRKLSLSAYEYIGSASNKTGLTDLH